MKTVELVNVVERSEHCENFNILDLETRTNIPVGGFAKVCASGERFWVKIVTNEAGKYTGKVSNNLLLTSHHELKHGDIICFDVRHIFDVDESP